MAPSNNSSGDDKSASNPNSSPSLTSLFPPGSRGVHRPRGSSGGGGAPNLSQLLQALPGSGHYHQMSLLEILDSAIDLEDVRGSQAAPRKHSGRSRAVARKEKTTGKE